MLEKKGPHPYPVRMPRCQCKIIVRQILTEKNLILKG
jgi:hypothetical protein